MNKVSIVTVVYNRPHDLEKTIISCASQTYQNKEYIIIDGGSFQETIQVIKKYHDSISFWISEPDKGIFNAMNKSLSYVTGDYVIFMNAGDTFFSDEVLSSIFGCHTYDESILYGHSILHNKYGYLCRINNSIYEKGASKSDFVFRGQGICHQAMFTKSDVLKKIRFDEKYPLGADYDTTYKIVQLAPNSYVNLKIPICVFDDLSGGASHRQLKRVIDERVKMFNYKKDFRYYCFLLKQYTRESIRRLLSIVIPFAKKRYIERKYSKSLESLCV